MLSKRQVLLAGLVTGASAFGIGSMAYGVGDAPVPSAGEAFTTPTKAPVAKVESDMAESFRIFREQAPVAMPKDAAQQVGSHYRFGRNSALARPIDTPNGRGWIIPGAGYVCMAVPDPVDGFGTSCASTADAKRRGLWVRMGGTRADGRVVDTLIVPDEDTAQDARGRRLVTGSNGVVSRVTDESDRTTIDRAG